MVEQIFLSPQVKWNVIISNKLAYASCLTICQTKYNLRKIGIYAAGRTIVPTRKKILGK